MFKRKKSLPLVSIIVNCYNGEKYLDFAIKSILNQNYKNWELIFFDNNSKDDSRSIIKKYKDKRIKYFKSTTTHKLYKARNLAIQKCKGEFISFLDVDDFWRHNKIKKQIQIFLLHKNVDLVFSNVFIINEGKKKKYIYLKKKIDGEITPKKLINNNFVIPILTTMVRKKIFKKIKFNDSYSIIGDFDFFVRASLNFKIEYMHEALAYYRIHGLNLTIRRIDLNIKELNNWLNKIKKKKIFKKFNFKNIISLINLLRIKQKIILNKKHEAIKLIFQRPLSFSKLKYLFLIFKNEK